MDISKIVWPLVIVAVLGLGWLVTEGGVNYQFKKYNEGATGTDPEKDALQEKGLSKLAGFLMTTFRYQKAADTYNAAIDRFPNGENVWWNSYQLARCQEKLKNFDEAVRLLVFIRDQDGDSHDERIPGFDNLNLRIQKLVETHEIKGVS